MESSVKHLDMENMRGDITPQANGSQYLTVFARCVDDGFIEGSLEDIRKLAFFLNKMIEAVEK